MLDDYHKVLINYLVNMCDVNKLTLYWFDKNKETICVGEFQRVSALDNIIVKEKASERYVSSGELGIKFHLSFDIAVAEAVSYFRNNVSELHRQIRCYKRKIEAIEKVQNAK